MSQPSEALRSLHIGRWCRAHRGKPSNGPTEDCSTADIGAGGRGKVRIVDDRDHRDRSRMRAVFPLGLDPSLITEVGAAPPELTEIRRTVRRNCDWPPATRDTS